MPLSHRFFAILVDGLGLGIFLIAALNFIKLMMCFECEEIFSTKTIDLLYQIGRWVVVMACYASLNYTLLSILTTLHHPKGQRLVSVTFGTMDIERIFLAMTLMLVAWILREGYRLKAEQSLTI